MRPKENYANFRYKDTRPCHRAQENRHETGDEDPVPTTRPHVRRHVDKNSNTDGGHVEGDEFRLVVVLGHLSDQKSLIGTNNN